MRIAVMGAGGMGGYFGALLARAGEEVTLIARGAHLEAIRTSGLTLKSRLAGDFTLRVKATDDPGEVGPVELVLFCVKAYDTATAAEQIHPMVGPDTMVLSIQNGIDNEEQIGRVVGSEPVIGGVGYASSKIEAPGVIAHLTSGPRQIVFGELAGETSPRTERLQRTLQSAGISAEVRPDIHIPLWEKFLFVCAVNGVTALTRLPMGPIVACPETCLLLRGTMEEVEAVARESGIMLPENCVDKAFALSIRVESSLRGSMYYDLAAGRRMELEALNGTTVGLGREHGIPTPLNFAIYATLKPFADGAPIMP
jgi:2-dehydropantoate 2-reductase